MKKAIMAIAAVAGASTISAPAHALAYYVVSSWYENGQHFCKYGNGTILNVGIKLCPFSIEG